MIALLLTLALTLPAAPAPLALRVTLSPDQALSVSWRPPRGQARAAVILRNPDGDQLIGSVEGAGGVWTRDGGSIDMATVVREGDTIWVTTWDTRSALLAQGRAVVPWRLWLAVVGRTPPRWQVLLPVVRRK